jgi:hypothetical protein
MSTSPVSYPEFIRFYERVTRLKPASSVDFSQSNSGEILNISAEAKKKFVFKEAFSEVLEKIKK